MSKRRQGQGCKCCKKPRPSQRRRKHLYVVLDDCHNGYTIHKLDLQDSSFYESSHDCTAELKCLPEPPALRLAQACHHDMFFAALGRYIFIANKRMYHAQPPALLYDTEAAALNVGPRLPGYLRESLVVAIPTAASSAGEYENGTQQEEQHLYAMTSQYDENKEHLLVSFKVMSWAPCSPNDLATDPWIPSHEWSWKSVPSSLAPFYGTEESITSFVVHPDGHTIFISTEDRFDQRRKIGTYSFDTKNCEWRSLGKWVLPFRNQGYFDTDLNAWVGLCRDGYICSCQVASRSSGKQGAPHCKMTKQKLLRKVHTDEGHLGATLTYVGNNNYCLVESVVRDDVECEHVFGDHDGCAIHITLFGLKYDCKGDLQLTRRTTSSYAVSKHVLGFSPQAFWM